MDSLQSLLPKVLRRRGLYGHASASLVTYRVQDWLLKELPAFGETFRVARLKDGTLTIECAHGTASQEISFLLPKLREYLKQECPEATVGDIRVERTRRTS